jgi:hypothetical protein
MARNETILERVARIEAKWAGVTREQFINRMIADAYKKGHLRGIDDDDTPPPASRREIVSHRQEMIRIDGYI